MAKSSFVIAGTDSGCGKTTVTLAVLAALGNRDLHAQAFKAGPDYIDPTYHNAVLPQQKSRNLDLWLCREEQVKKFYAGAMSRARVGVVEGVMGLFDGKTDKSSDTSTASLAKLLNLPVILVIDASRMAQSVGAYVHGFLEYDRKVKIAGVILNRVGGEGHYQFLKEIIESKFPISVFGYLPKETGLEIPERHLGLIPSLEHGVNMERLRELAEKCLDVEGILRKTATLTPTPLPQGRRGKGEGGCAVRLGLAYDAAFHFYYEDALDGLREAGFEIVPFSPLKDESLPKELDVLYLGGGFPEVFDRELSNNTSMIQSIRSWAENRKMIYAECGGLMYLVNIGVIPGKIRMTDRLQNFGYKEIQPSQDNFLFTSKDKIRIHEFHYSVWEGPGDGQVYWNGHILASYYHCHLGAYPQAVRRWKEILHEIPAH